MIATHYEIRHNFRMLDGQRLGQLEFDATDDLRRLAKAWLALWNSQRDEADALLESLTGDDTAHPADVAFVRAFRREAEGDYRAIVDLLEPHLANLEGSLQSFRLYLRSADALLKLREFEKMQQVLDPLLQPPGRTGTLEALFIVLQGMMATNVDKERLIEHVALLDGLLEKGFRLTETDNVIFYATWLEHHRIEPPIAPLLNTHAAMVESFRTENRELITTLLIMGDRHKAPAAVRAAARSYAKSPFPFEGIDTERVSYLFSSHEEHDAARHSILMGYPKTRIHKQQNLWGPLLLTSYYAGRWKEAMDILRDHRDELPRLKFYDNARAIKGVTEFQLRRFTEAHKTIEDMGIRFYDQTSGSEGAAHLLTVLALKGPEAVLPVAVRAFTIKKEDPAWLNEYATTVLTQLAVHDRADALDVWIRFLGEVLRREIKAETLQRIGDMMVEWALPQNADTVVEVLEKIGEKPRAVLLRAFVACERGDAPTMEKFFAETLVFHGHTTPEFLLLRARCRRRLGLLEEAGADLDSILAEESFLRRHAALGVREGLWRESRRNSAEVEAVRGEALEHIRKAARNGDEAAIMTYEMNQLASGESALAYLALARDAVLREPENIEGLRLARKAARSARADDDVRRDAVAIQEAWEKDNLLLSKVSS